MKRLSILASAVLLVASLALAACEPAKPPSGAMRTAFGAILIQFCDDGKAVCLAGDLGSTTIHLTSMVDKTQHIYDVWCIEENWSRDGQAHKAAVVVYQATPADDETNNWLPVKMPTDGTDCSAYAN